MLGGNPLLILKSNLIYIYSMRLIGMNYQCKSFYTNKYQLIINHPIFVYSAEDTAYNTSHSKLSLSIINIPPNKRNERRLHRLLVLP